MDIFSKKDGPRAEDVQAKRMISENMPAIRKLADQISNGGYTRMRQEQAQRKQQPQPEGKLIFDMTARAHSEVPDPYIKISMNNRVVMADRKTARQLHLLGEIRGNFVSKKLALATKENGFFSPLDEEISDLIGHLDGVEITRDFTESDLATQLEELLIPNDQD